MGGAKKSRARKMLGRLAILNAFNKEKGKYLGSNSWGEVGVRRQLWQKGLRDFWMSSCF